MSDKTKKILMLGLWAAVIANFFLPTPDWLNQTLKAAGIFLLVAHLSACVLFAPKISRHGSPIVGFLLVLLFGRIQLRQLPDYHGF